MIRVRSIYFKDNPTLAISKNHIKFVADYTFQFFAMSGLFAMLSSMALTSDYIIFLIFGLPSIFLVFFIVNKIVSGIEKLDAFYLGKPVLLNFIKTTFANYQFKNHVSFDNQIVLKVRSVYSYNALQKKYNLSGNIRGLLYQKNSNKLCFITEVNDELKYLADFSDNKYLHNGEFCKLKLREGGSNV